MKSLSECRVPIGGAGPGLQAVPDLEGTALEASEASGQIGARNALAEGGGAK